MKKQLLALVMTLCSASWAAPVEYFRAVLSSDTLKNVMRAEGTLQVGNITHVATYRCLGCFDFDVELLIHQEVLETKTIHLATRLTNDRRIEVHLK